ncbi:MAG: hypothetical protein ACOY30_00325 [Bacillota bacterium]
MIGYWVTNAVIAQAVIQMIMACSPMPVLASFPGALAWVRIL